MLFFHSQSGKTAKQYKEKKGSINALMLVRSAQYMRTVNKTLVIHFRC